MNEVKGKWYGGVKCAVSRLKLGCAMLLAIKDSKVLKRRERMSVCSSPLFCDHILIKNISEGLWEISSNKEKVKEKM